MPLFEETGFPHASTTEVIDQLVIDMLRKFHTDGKDKSLDARIEKGFQEHTGMPFMKIADADGTVKIMPTYLRGAPGHGKTTAFKEAAKRVAKLTGMNVVINPGDEYKPNANDIILITMELSGQVSAVDFGGIPTKVSETGVDGVEYNYMAKLPNKRLAMLEHVTAAVLLLDDFANASPAIQNVALSILDEGRFQGLNLGNTLVGVTGNLGSLDRTHTSKSSAALDTRCRSFYVEDDLKSWINRIERSFSDKISDGGIVGFLRANQDAFAVKPADKGPYPCPRSWTNFLQDFRAFVYVNGRKYADDKKTAVLSSTKLQALASSSIGMEHGQKFAAYYSAMMSGAAPLARELLEEGKLSKASEERFKDRYANGHSADNQNFGAQFAFALSDYTVSMIKDDPSKNMKKAIERFAEGIFRVSNPIIGMASAHFANRLANQVESLRDSSGTSVKTEHKEQMVNIMAEHPNASADALETMIEAITGYAKVKGKMDLGQRRKKESKPSDQAPKA